MLRTSFSLLLFALFVSQGCWCKPAKNNNESNDYSDDTPDEYNDDEYPPSDDDGDGPGAVEESPQIVSKPKSYLHVPPGSNVTFPCAVINADDLAIVWKKDNQFLYTESQSLTSEPNRIVRTSDNSLTIYNVTVNDSSSNYECTILSEPKSISITHELLVDLNGISTTHNPISTTYKLPIDSNPTTQTVRVTPSDKTEVIQGQSVTLGCHTEVRPAPREIKWFHENKRLNDGSKTTLKGNYLTINKANRHDTGLYQCLLDNGMENPPLAAIRLVVKYAPEVHVEHETVHTGTGIESEITCIVHAHPRANVTWYKHQKKVAPEKGRIAIKDNKSKHTLKIMHTTSQDFGDYTCLAKNDFGDASRIISLTGAPSQAIIYGGEVTKSESGIVLKWRLESYSPITEYRLKYRRKGEEEWKVLTPRVTDGKGNQYMVEHLIEEIQPGSYEAILSARNAFGWSPPSIPHTFTGDYTNADALDVKQDSAAVSVEPLNAALMSLLVVSFCALRCL